MQNALKREQFYFGEPSGDLDDATRAALRRFQLRHGLPATGEIDTATLQALQSRADAGPATIMAEPPATKAPAPAAATVEKDREFLQKVETGREQRAPKVESAVPIAPPSSSATASIPASTETIQRKPEGSTSRPAEKPRQVATRKEERTPLAQSNDVPARRELEPEPIASAPPHRTESRVSPATTKSVEIDDDPDPLGPHGIRIIHSNRATTGPDGRTYIYEKKTTTISAQAVPVRRAVPVEPRKDSGFFHRLFKGNKDDKDD